MTLPQLRLLLAVPRTTAQLCVLGVAAGSLSALLIILFRLFIFQVQTSFVEHYDNFTSLPETMRWLIPLLGAAMITAFAYLTGLKYYRLGIPFVIHRIKTHYGVMPAGNTLNQFFGGALALICGFSVGREGPSVHLGAFASGWLGDYLKLPYNAIRTQAGCGIAAGIAASFNTPLAAVIFVMEVVLREYKIHVFVPIMLAAVAGTLLTRLVFGDGYELQLIPITELGILHYPYLVLCGMALGAMAWLFNSNMMLIIRTFKNVPMFARLAIAGIVTAVIGSLIPEAMGSGMGAIQFTMDAPQNIQLLVTILIGKLLATLFALGLGVPGGIIGPLIGLGVVIGTIMSGIPMWMAPESGVYGTYAVLGMAGMMAASLHAPLAALVTVMELTYSPEIIMPAMLVIVTAYVTGLQVFNNRSIFLQQLDFQELPYKISPAVDTLQKVGVMAECEQNIQLIEGNEDELVRMALRELNPSQRLIVKAANQDGVYQYSLAEFDVSLVSSDITPIRLQPLLLLSDRHTLADAFELSNDNQQGVVGIYHHESLALIGIIRWDQIRALLVKRNTIL